MEIRQIQFFLAIVDSGSFTAAAEKVFVSQSSLSKNIMSLEEELGLKLFDRSKREISLTDAGRAFLDHARKIDAANKAMIIDLDEHKAGQSPISIAAIPVLSEYGIIKHIASFGEKYPDIHINLEELDGLNILPALEDYRFELAITRHNFLDPEQFNSFEIFKDKLLVVVSKNNQHVSKSSISLKELSDDNFIVFDKVTTLHTLVSDACQKAGFSPTIFYSSHAKASVFGLVGANIGVALVPAKIYEYHQNPDVLAIPLDETIESNIVIAHLRKRKLPSSVLLFVDFLQAACRVP